MTGGQIEYTKSEGLYEDDFMICLQFELLSIVEKSILDIYKFLQANLEQCFELLSILEKKYL